MVFPDSFGIFFSSDNTARLISPTLQIDEVACLEFYYYFSTTNAGTLDVNFAKGSKTGDNILKLESSVQPHSGMEWNYQLIELKAADVSNKASCFMVTKIHANIPLFDLYYPYSNCF